MLKYILALAVLGLVWICHHKLRQTLQKNICPTGGAKDITAAEGSLGAAKRSYGDEGRPDDRNLARGEVETVAVSIDAAAATDYYRPANEKEKQDASARLLFQAARDHEAAQTAARHKNSDRQLQDRQKAREDENKRQLAKLRGIKTRKKVARQVAKKNIVLDDEQIKKIKIKAAGGKLK